MMTNTAYDPRLLAQWAADLDSTQEIEQLLEPYLHQYDCAFSSFKQTKHFADFVRGLLSPLDRKSIEPIALHFHGEKSVRPMQQFFTRAPLNERQILDTYQRLLAAQVNHSGSMLSVDDTSFVKKGTHSIGVKRQYCGRLGKRENCQIGVFLSYAGNSGYGLVDYELYIPQEWFQDSCQDLRDRCRLPAQRNFLTKNHIAQNLLNHAFETGRFQAQWVGCDAAYGCDHAFLDGLQLPEGVWYFAATNAKEQVFLEQPGICGPTPDRSQSRGRPRKHPVWTVQPVSVKCIAENPDAPWELVTLAEGSKGPIVAQRFIMRVVACRKDGNRSYVKPGEEVWLYIRKYEDGTIKYFVSNAPKDTPYAELDRAATLRWPIEQCFEECKSYLGMTHYEGCSYPGWKRHMLFVMIAHLFTTQIREDTKKRGSSKSDWP
uniref:IS701 family transposase n=1 Tax=Enterocloster clostridioformis TaxID=1531 RepID=UPI002A82F551|nr:IS701 family transposase [Enterocloster clostridioformis]